MADFVKRHRTIKLIHLLRNYSALAVVISSAVLVTATNVASGKNDGNVLFGYWGGTDNGQNPAENRANAKSNRKTDLAFAPLAKSNLAVNPDTADDSESLVILQKQGLVSGANAPMKDPEEDGGVKIYEVESGDTISSIAMANHITANTILWANDIDNIDSIKPGDKLFILPVAGLSYTVKKGDDLGAIATKFKADRAKIIAFNSLPADGKIEEGQEIVIPDGYKDVQQPASTNSGLIGRRQYATTTGGAPSVSGWRKLEGNAGAGHRFPYGYCTWYVAQRRYVPWSGNAGTWLYHAKAAGYRTGKSPVVGAIMVSSESWWGHVAVVESVGSGSFTVSEMNYRGWAKKSTRVVSTSSRVVKGFIY